MAAWQQPAALIAARLHLFQNSAHPQTGNSSRPAERKVHSAMQVVVWQLEPWSWRAARLTWGRLCTLLTQS